MQNSTTAKIQKTYGVDTVLYLKACKGVVTYDSSCHFEIESECKDLVRK